MCPLPRDLNTCTHIPQLGFLVVATANESKRQGHQTSAQNGKDSKKLDLFGQKLDSTGGLVYRIVNQQALLGHCDPTLWDNILMFKDQCRKEFTVIVEEDKIVSRTILQPNLDTAAVSSS